MKSGAILVSLVVSSLVLGCQGSSNPSQTAGPIRYDPPNTDFAARLNLTPPVTEDQAKAIAAEAAGGTAVSATQERDGNVLMFEVLVDTPAGRMEVEVRASDGGVVEIEPDDGN